MNTSAVYLAAVRARNESLFAAKEMRITVTSFEAQLRAAFEAGDKAGTRRAAEAEARSRVEAAKSLKGMSKLFDKMFK